MINVFVVVIVLSRLRILCYVNSKYCARTLANDERGRRDTPHRDSGRQTSNNWSLKRKQRRVGAAQLTVSGKTNGSHGVSARTGVPPVGRANGDFARSAANHAVSSAAADGNRNAYLLSKADDDRGPLRASARPPVTTTVYGCSVVQRPCRHNASVPPPCVVLLRFVRALRGHSDVCCCFSRRFGFFSTVTRTQYITRARRP